VVDREGDRMSARRSSSARERVTALCLALPEAEDHGPGQHAAFTVRGKKFAYYLDDHHGDGRRSVCCRAPAGENTALVAADPERYFIPAYIGPRGWVGYYVDLGREDWGEVRELIIESYRLAAPKRLAAALDVSE
jgi:phosphoribosylglycinamide formyltransferase-1